jgi:4,5-DOPA dioxygenase extradiol
MSAQRMPAIFFGHGSPMNAIEPNRYANAWQQFGAMEPRPRAILAVSAHWYTRGIAVTAVTQPRTIHDFGGFPPALYEVQYPAPGAPWLAERVRDLLAPVEVALDHSWGLDHGTWSVLVHAYPQADIPVVQLSIDATRTPAQHYELAQKLAALRDEGVLILGSGNVVHNLRYAQFESAAPPYYWAMRFNDAVRRAVTARTHDMLIDYGQLGDDGRVSVPTPEHYLPLLYVIAQQRDDDTVSFPVDGIELGSISMLTVRVGF